jgi:hypothetical protein
VSGPPAIEIAWNRAPGGETCIDRQDLVDKVEATVGHRTFVPAGRGDTTVRGTVGPDPAGRGWLAVVEARRAGAAAFRRELALNAFDCRQLDEAMVLVVALMVDSAEPEAPALTIPVAPPSAAVSIGPDVAFALGMLPGVAAGVGLASDATIPPLWPVALWANAWPLSQTLQDGSGGQLGAWTIGMGLCPLTHARAGWAAFGCAGATGGAIYSNGIGLDVARSRVRPYAQAELRAGLRVRMGGPLFARFELGAAVPVARDRYQYTQADGTVHQVFEAAAVIPLGHVGLEVRVP